MNFSNLLAPLDAAVEAHLCDDALYSTGAGAPVPVRVMIDFPRAADRLTGMSFTRSRPVMRVARSACPLLVEGHTFQVGTDLFAVAEAPSATDDGRWWSFEVEPG